MHVRARFRMNRDDVGTGGGQRLDPTIDGRAHQVDVERLARVRRRRVPHARGEGQLRVEVPSHYNGVDPAPTGLVDSTHFFTQPREVGGKDRWRDQRLVHWLSLSTTPG